MEEVALEKNSIDIIKEEIVEAEKLVNEKKLILQSELIKEEEEKPKKYKKDIVYFADKFVRSNDELEKIKKKAIKDIRSAIKKYIYDSRSTRLDMINSISKLQGLSKYVDHSLYDEFDSNRVRFTLDRKHEHAEELSLKSLMCAVFTNEGDRENTVMKDFNGISCFENYLTNTWLINFK